MDQARANWVCGWSAQEITGRLGISSSVFKKAGLGAREIAQIREAGIAHLELSTNTSFDYRNGKQVSEIARECAIQGINIASFHTALFPFQSADEGERRTAVRDALYLAHTAVEMGAGILSCHLCTDAQTRRSIHEMLEELKDLPLVLAIENVGRVAIAAALSLVDEFDSERFKMLLDIGHERDGDGVNPFVKKDRARAAVAQCGDRLCAVHLHETLALKERADHRAPLHKDGLIEWGEVFAGLQDVGYRGVLLFEDGRGVNPEEWVRATGEFPAKFIERYGAPLSQCTAR
jgi:sugar phosphate isomerase/epimerase